MNSVNSVVFSRTSYIRTDELRTYFVIFIVSLIAAILRHVSPRPNDSNFGDPNAEDKHVRSFMGRVTNYYWQYQKFFSENSSFWVICAVFNSAVTLSDQQRIMKRKLRDIRLIVDTDQTYSVSYTADHSNRDSIFINDRGDIIRVYVENREIRRIPHSQSIASLSTATISSTTAITTTITASGSGPAQSH